MMLMSILKTAENLLRKILPQPRFKPGFSHRDERLSDNRGIYYFDLTKLFLYLYPAKF